VDDQGIHGTPQRHPCLPPDSIRDFTCRLRAAGCGPAGYVTRNVPTHNVPSLCLSLH